MTEFKGKFERMRVLRTKYPPNLWQTRLLAQCGAQVDNTLSEPFDGPTVEGSSDWVRVEGARISDEPEGSDIGYCREATLKIKKV